MCIRDSPYFLPLSHSLLPMNRGLRNRAVGATTVGATTTTTIIRRRRSLVLGFRGKILPFMSTKVLASRIGIIGVVGEKSNL